jgi:desulfoferrodoxin (superoxide reductase-like protein)
MSNGDPDLLEGVNTDLSHGKASTHAAKLNLEQENGTYNLEIDISAHAEEPPHHTAWLKVFVNDTPAGQIDPEPPFYTGVFDVQLTDIDPGDEIRVQAKCNLHGVWESSVSA